MSAEREVHDLRIRVKKLEDAMSGLVRLNTTNTENVAMLLEIVEGQSKQLGRLTLHVEMAFVRLRDLESHQLQSRKAK